MQQERLAVDRELGAAGRAREQPDAEFLLEYDTGSEGLLRLVAKLAGYAGLAGRAFAGKITYPAL